MKHYLRRSFDAVLDVRESVDRLGHEVYGRLFPFGVVAHIRELDEHGQLDEYDESFLPGCTVRDQQVAATKGGPGWISLTVDHDRAFDARLGYCRALVEQDDGAYGTFQLYPSKATIACEMLGSSHRGLSIEFVDRVPPLVDGSLRQRRSIYTRSVTATPVPVYESAGVLAMRAEPDDAVIEGATPNLDRVREMLDAL